MQFAEGLSDRQAAEQVRSLLDWKYILSLELDDGGFDFSVLSEFRNRLVEGQAERLLFDIMLELFKTKSLPKARGNQRTDSTHVLQAIYQTSELEWLAKIPAVEILRQVWIQHYQFVAGEAEWRAIDNTSFQSVYRFAV